MANETAGTIPPPPTETNSTAEASAPASSLQSSESSYSDRASRAKSPADIRAIINEAKKPVAQKQQQPTLEAQPEQIAAEEPEAEGTAPETESSVTDETASETEQTESAAETEIEDDGDGPIKIPTAKQLRISPAEADQVGRLTAALMRRNRDWTMEDAFNAAKKQLGIKPAAEADAANAEPAKSDLPETMEEVDSTLSDLESEHEKALTELRFEDAAKLDRKIRSLDRHRLNIERKTEQSQLKARADFDRSFDGSNAKAQELYAFAADQESPGFKRMLEIEADLKANKDPLYFSADKPLVLAQMAAKELSIPPRRKGQAQAPAKAAVPPVSPPKPRSILPSGSNRSTQPIANAKPAIDSEVQGITKVHELRKFLGRVTGGQVR